MKIYLLPFLFLFTFNLSSQEITETNTDLIFKLANEAYQNSDFQRSLELTLRGLDLAPDYHDIRLLQIRNYWAIGNFSAADKDLYFLLENAPNYEGLNDLVLQRINRFDDKHQALDFINRVEKIYPGEMSLQVKKAQIYSEMKQPKEARTLAMDLLRREDLTSGDRYLLATILRETITNEIGINYQYIGFSDDYTVSDPWHSVSGEFQHNFGRTATLARATYSERGSSNGTLYELEAYPVLTKKLYTFINVGFSNGELFPDMRGSLSVFYNFARIFEGEIGGRVQKYNEDSFYTGILGLTLYHQKFYFNARTFLGPVVNDQMVQNYQGNVRYYYSDPDNYIFLRIGNGISPDERILSTQTLDNPLLEAYYGTLGINFSMGIHHFVQAGAGVLIEDITGDTKGIQSIGSIGYRYRF